MAWIKTQKGQLIDVATVVIDEVIAAHEVRGDASFARFTLGIYNSPMTSVQVLSDIERWIMLGADGVFTMPDKDYGKVREDFMGHSPTKAKPQVFLGHDASKPIGCAYCPKCGAGFKSYMAAIDEEKATDDLFKKVRSVGPVVTTFPIDDSVSTKIRHRQALHSSRLLDRWYWGSEIR